MLGHTYMRRSAYQKHGSGDLHLALGAEDGDEISRRLLVGEANLGVGFRLDIVDEDALLAQERTVVLARNRHSLINVVLILRIP